MLAWAWAGCQRAEFGDEFVTGGELVGLIILLPLLPGHRHDRQGSEVTPGARQAPGPALASAQECVSPLPWHVTGRCAEARCPFFLISTEG